METNRPQTLIPRRPTMLEDLQAPLTTLAKEIRDTWRRL
jgi:hypothetical protein